MRALQLLAIAAVCPLAAFGGGCEKIEQRVGTYQTVSMHNGRPDTSTSGGDGDPTNTDGSSEATLNGGSDATINSDSASGPSYAGTSGGQTSFPPTPNTTQAAGNPVCKPDSSLVAERMRVDLYVAMDANIMPPYTGLWETITGGLRQFVLDGTSSGTGVGLRFFGPQCDPVPYNLQPTVEVGELPGNQAKLVAATNSQTTYTTSAMAPALQGSIDHQAARARANPDVKQVVVLMTDGFIQDITCRYNAQDIENIADSGFNTSTSIETYVIGFGFPDTMSAIADEVLARITPLDSIAAHGGTRKATILKSTDGATAVSAALHAVRRAAQPCDYKVPVGVDTTKLNLGLVPLGQIPRVDGPASCGQKPGFWYEPADGTPTTMKLCSTSCQTLQQNDYAAAIVLGCPTLRR